MKRRNFLKCVLGSVVIGPSVLKAESTKKQKDSFAKEHNVYLGLLNNGNEIVRFGLMNNKDYRRIKATKNWELSCDGNMYNMDIMEFPQAKKDWGDITELAFFDAERRGNLLIFGKLAYHVFINKGDTVSFHKRYIKIEL